MMTFRNHRLRDFAVPMSTNWLLNDLAEAKGKQELYTRQSPQLLKALREMALVQRLRSRALHQPGASRRRGERKITTAFCNKVPSAGTTANMICSRGSIIFWPSRAVPTASSSNGLAR